MLFCCSSVHSKTKVSWLLNLWRWKECCLSWHVCSLRELSVRVSSRCGHRSTLWCLLHVHLLSALCITSQSFLTNLTPHCEPEIKWNILEIYAPHVDLISRTMLPHTVRLKIRFWNLVGKQPLTNTQQTSSKCWDPVVSLDPVREKRFTKTSEMRFPAAYMWTLRLLFITAQHATLKRTQFKRRENGSLNDTDSTASRNVTSCNALTM